MGISLDPVETQKKFRESLSLPFPLLSDSDGTVARAYGVLAEGGAYAKRVTFVIAPDGKITHVESNKLDTEGAAAACPLRKKK